MQAQTRTWETGGSTVEFQNLRFETVEGPPGASTEKDAAKKELKNNFFKRKVRCRRGKMIIIIKSCIK